MLKDHRIVTLTRAEEEIQSSQPGIHRRSRPSATMWHLTLLSGDYVLLVACLFFALLTHHHLKLVVLGYTLGALPSKIVIACFALIAWGISANILRAQELVYASSRLRNLLSVLFAFALTSLFWMLAVSPFVVSVTLYLQVVVYFLAASVPTLCLWRLILAKILSLPRYRQQAVILGASPAGAIIAAELRKARHPIADVLGYVSEDSSEQTSKDEAFRFLGDKKTLRLLARSGAIDMIIMAIDYRESPALFQEALEAAQLGIPVLPMARVYESTCGKIPVEHIGDQWFVTLPAEQVFSLPYLFWRKILDLTFGLVGLLALLILFPVVAAAISIDSPGPIFYRQERLGYRGKPFLVLKFRSMRLDAESVGQAVWAAKNDMRTTRVGRFLRATHLDELPQVINILRGDMTLIGPRPERKVFVTELEKTIPFYRCRLSVKPGLTGWAQVKYPYTSSGHEALIKLQYDLYYVKHQSVTIDVLILLKTVVEVLLCHGR